VVVVVVVVAGAVDVAVDVAVEMAVDVVVVVVGLVTVVVVVSTTVEVVEGGTNNGCEPLGIENIKKSRINATNAKLTIAITLLDNLNLSILL
jgi:hypothetical protein